MAINFIKKEDLSHITRTTRQWETTIDRYEIIPKGVLCIELCNDKLTKIKIGNGHLIYEQLPYVSDVNLSDYYTKEETNNLIKNLKSIKIKGEASSLSDLPSRGNEEGDLWFVNKPHPDTHSRYDEYVWYNNKWESFGSSDIDLSEYAKKSYVDTHIQEVQNEITEIIESGYLHKHNNKNILDHTSAVYNVEKDNKLRDLHNYDDTELREKAHTHLNKNILDQTDAVYNRDKDDKLRGLHNYDDTTVKQRLSSLESVSHSHSNQDVLDRTTAAFTKEQALTLLDCKDFKGTDGVHDGYHGFVPAPTKDDVGKVLGANGEWVEGGSSGGDTITQGGGIEITTDSQTGVKTVSVNAGTGLEIDQQTGELNVTATGGDSIAEGNGIDITTDQQTGVKTISVDIGNGLQFNQNSEIDIKTGDGLSINQNNELDVGISNGLQFDSNNEIEINTGDGLLINQDNELELDKATKNSIGGVIVGDNIDVSNGTISVPIATDSDLGVVKPTDGLLVENTGELSVNTGDGLSINQDNEIEINIGEGLSINQDNELEVNVGDGLSINASDEVELDKATTSSIGGVIVGDNIDVNDGTISVPKAASNKLGVVKPSDGLSVDSNGVLTVDTGDGLSIDSTTKEVNVNVGVGLSIDGNNNIILDPATANTLGGVKIGEGLSIDENNVVSSTVYEEGQGIIFETSGSADDGFDVKNKEYYFEDEARCEITGNFGPRSYWRTYTDDPCLAVIFYRSDTTSMPLYIGLTENSVKMNQSWDGNVLGPDGTFDYKGYTWYYTANYGLYYSSGVDQLGHLQTISGTSADEYEDVAKHVIDLAELISPGIKTYDVWNTGTGWLNGAYISGTSDTFATDWYKEYHSDNTEYFELPKGATEVKLTGISTSDTVFGGNHIDLFNDSKHHIGTFIGESQWYELLPGTVYLQFGVKWSENNDRNISASDIKSVTLEIKVPKNNAITAKLGNGLTFDENDAITLDESIKLIIHCVGDPLT